MHYTINRLNPMEWWDFLNYICHICDTNMIMYNIYLLLRVRSHKIMLYLYRLVCYKKCIFIVRAMILLMYLFPEIIVFHDLYKYWIDNMLQYHPYMKWQLYNHYRSSYKMLMMLELQRSNFTLIIDVSQVSRRCLLIIIFIVNWADFVGQV